MKRVTIAALVSALVFGILSTWLGPKMIAYWYAPPVPSGAAVAFNCTDAVTWAMNKLVLTQILCTKIPDPPADVPALPAPSGTLKTMRQRSVEHMQWLRSVTLGVCPRAVERA